MDCISGSTKYDEAGRYESDSKRSSVGGMPAPVPDKEGCGCLQVFAGAV